MLVLGFLVALAGCGNLASPVPVDTDGDDTDVGGSGSGSGGSGSGSGGSGSGSGGSGSGSGGSGSGSGGGSSSGADTDQTSGDATTLQITELFDGTENGELQYVEIFNPTTSTFDLDGWALNVGKAPDVFTYRFPATNLASGETFVVCSTAGSDAFELEFGVPCDDVEEDVLQPGDAPVALLDPGNRPKDVYGPVISASSGWEYEDSVVKRKAGKLATITFSLAEWTKTSGEGDANPGSRD